MRRLGHILRSAKGRVRPWVAAAEGSGYDSCRLFGVVGTWMESDVIGATVRHLYSQGCEEVFVVDNDSPDETTAEAEAAGATVSVRYTTMKYDETTRLSMMSTVVDHVSRTVGGERIWWMYSDADEFTFGPNRDRVVDWLPRVPRGCRIVGAFVLNHYPAKAIPTPLGAFPLEWQPLAEDFAQLMCPRGHRKHPLIRWDRHGPVLRVGQGFHKIYGPGQLREPAWELVMHHFPFRDETFTRQRLTVLIDGALGGRGRAVDGGESARHMEMRRRALDAVYDERWDEIASFVSGAGGVVLLPWREILTGRANGQADSSR